MSTHIDKCIYCNKSTEDGIELNVSHVIPETLSNSNITIPNVCKIEHNRVFGDTFEFDVARQFEHLRNYYNIKGKDGKGTSYQSNITINGNEVVGKMWSFMRFLKKGEVVLRTPTNSKLKLCFPDFKDIPSHKAVDYSLLNEFQVIETLDAESEQIISVLKSNSMKRLAAKICFEWYCKQHDLRGKPYGCDDIVNFICHGTENSDEIVHVIINEQLYDTLEEQFELGSHVLCEIGNNQKVQSVLMSFFGLVIYEVKVIRSSLYLSRGSCIYKFDGFRPDGTRDRCELAFPDAYLQLESVEVGIEVLSERIRNKYCDIFDSVYLTLRSLKRDVLEVKEIIMRQGFSPEQILTYTVGFNSPKIYLVTLFLYDLANYESQYDNTKSFNENLLIMYGGYTATFERNQTSKLQCYDDEGINTYIAALKKGIEFFELLYEKEIRNN